MLFPFFLFLYIFIYFLDPLLCLAVYGFARANYEGLTANYEGLTANYEFDFILIHEYY